jgi:hypothetical protein
MYTRTRCTASVSVVTFSASVLLLPRQSGGGKVREELLSNLLAHRGEVCMTVPNKYCECRAGHEILEDLRRC